jgi:hypothetical protein
MGNLKFQVHSLTSRANTSIWGFSDNFPARNKKLFGAKKMKYTFIIKRGVLGRDTALYLCKFFCPKILKFYAAPPNDCVSSTLSGLSTNYSWTDLTDD